MGLISGIFSKGLETGFTDGRVPFAAVSSKVAGFSSGSGSCFLKKKLAFLKNNFLICLIFELFFY